MGVRRAPLSFLEHGKKEWNKTEGLGVRGGRGSKARAGIWGEKSKNIERP